MFANASAIRVLRIVRLLRSATRIKAMQRVAATVYLSMPAIGNMSVLMFIALFIWSMIGVEIYNGSLAGKCGFQLPTSTDASEWFFTDIHCRKSCPIENLQNCDILEQNDCSEVFLYPMPESLKTLANDLGAFTYGPVIESSQSPAPTEIYTLATRGIPEVLLPNLLPPVTQQAYCVYGPNPGQDQESFDNMGLSFLQGYLAVISDGWSDACFRLWKAFGLAPIVSILYSIIVLFCAHFVVYLALAVMSEEFERHGKHKGNEFYLEDGKGGTGGSAETYWHENTTERGIASNPLNGKGGASRATSNALTAKGQGNNDPSIPTQRRKVLRVPSRDTFHGNIQYICRCIVGHYLFSTLVTGLIFANAVILVIEHEKLLDHPHELKILRYINNSIVFSFCVEMALRMLALGLRKYFKSYFNIFDCIIVIVSVVDTGIHTFSPNTAGTGISALKSLRLGRLLKFVRFIPPLQKLGSIIFAAMPYILSICVLLLLTVFAFAVTGMQFFGGKETPKMTIHYPDSHMLHTEDIHPTFNTLWTALVSSYHILSAENIAPLIYQHMAATGRASSIYFVVLSLLGFFIFNSLFLAVILSSFRSFHAKVDRQPPLDPLATEFPWYSVSSVVKRVLRTAGTEFRERCPGECSLCGGCACEILDACLPDRPAPRYTQLTKAKRPSSVSAFSIGNPLFLVEEQSQGSSQASSHHHGTHPPHTAAGQSKQSSGTFFRNLISNTTHSTSVSGISTNPLVDVTSPLDAALESRSTDTSQFITPPRAAQLSTAHRMSVRLKPTIVTPPLYTPASAQSEGKESNDPARFELSLEKFKKTKPEDMPGQVSIGMDSSSEDEETYVPSHSRYTSPERNAMGRTKSARNSIRAYMPQAESDTDSSESDASGDEKREPESVSTSSVDLMSPPFVRPLDPKQRMVEKRVSGELQLQPLRNRRKYPLSRGNSANGEVNSYTSNRTLETVLEEGGVAITNSTSYSRSSASLELFPLHSSASTGASYFQPDVGTLSHPPVSSTSTTSTNLTTLSTSITQVISANPLHNQSNQLNGYVTHHHVIPTFGDTRVPFDVYNNPKGFGKPGEYRSKRRRRDGEDSDSDDDQSSPPTTARVDFIAWRGGAAGVVLNIPSSTSYSLRLQLDSWGDIRVVPMAPWRLPPDTPTQRARALQKGTAVVSRTQAAIDDSIADSTYFSQGKEKDQRWFRRLWRGVKQFATSLGLRTQGDGRNIREILKPIDITEVAREAELAGVNVKLSLPRFTPRLMRRARTHSALGIFRPRDPIRVRIALLVTDPIFENFILLLIFVSSVNLAIEGQSVSQCRDLPTTDPNSCPTMNKYLLITDYVTTSCFVLELVLKVLAQGLLFHPIAYLRDPWNTVDMIVVIIAFSTTFINRSAVKGLRAFRALRALRPLRFVARFPDLKVVVNSLLVSLPRTIVSGLLVLLILIILALIGLQNFKGYLHTCNDPDPNVHLHKDLCTGNFSLFGETCGFLPTPEDELACRASATGVSFPRIWEPRAFNFENLGESLLSMYSVLTSEDWFVHMDVTSKAKLYWEGKQSSTLATLFFLASHFVLVFILFPALTSVIIESFTEMKAVSRGLELLDRGKRTWVQSFQLILSSRPIARELLPGEKKINKLLQERQSYLLQEATALTQQSIQLIDTEVKALRQSAWLRARQFAFRVVQNPIFEQAVLAMILLNAVLLALRHRNMNEKLSKAVDALNQTCVAFFFLEAVIKVFGLGWKMYLKSSWDRFDFFLVIISFFTLGAAIFGGSNISSAVRSPIPSFLRSLRILRAGRLIRHREGLRRMFRALHFALPSLFNIAFLLCLLLFVYTIVGMSMFGGVRKSNRYSLQNHVEFHFNNFFSGFHTLFVIATGEGWTQLMYDYRIRPPYCVQGVNCPDPYMTALYFSSFILVTYLILLRMLAAVVSDAFLLASESSEGTVDGVIRLTSPMLQKYQTTWTQFDPEATGKIKMIYLRYACFLYC